MINLQNHQNIAFKYYSFVNPVPYSFLKSTKQRTQLQIVPYQKNNFDLFSLITFFDCTVSSYISTKVFKARKKKAGHSIDYQIYGYHIKVASVVLLIVKGHMET